MQSHLVSDQREDWKTTTSSVFGDPWPVCQHQSLQQPRWLLHLHLSARQTSHQSREMELTWHALRFDQEESVDGLSHVSQGKQPQYHQ